MSYSTKQSYEVLAFLNKAHSDAATVGEQYVIEKAIVEIERLLDLYDDCCTQLRES